MKNKLITALAAGLLLLCMLPSYAQAENLAGIKDIFTAATEDGKTLFTIGDAISEGDEYISRDNVLYRIKSIKLNQFKNIGFPDFTRLGFLDFMIHGKNTDIVIIRKSLLHKAGHKILLVVFSRLPQ